MFTLKSVCVTAFTFVVFSCFAQKPIGIWQGKLVVGRELSIIFHISGTEDRLSATLAVPEQGAKGIQVNSVKLTGDSIHLDLMVLRGAYKGKFIDDSTINGIWIQGIEVPLLLKKVQEIKKPFRPQTPTPPFPYRSENVIFYNQDSTIRYGGTITIPNEKANYPAVLLLSGSGQQNRDEELFDHKPFAVLADFLTKNGVIVLRVDDRGTGETTGELKNATTAVFSDDAMVAFSYLKKIPEVNKHKMGLLGHSEGGMIAQMLAAGRDDVDFVILMAAPGEKGSDLMVSQNRAILKTSGIPQAFIEPYLDLYKKMMDAIVTGADDSSVRTSAVKILDDWMLKNSREVVTATTGITDDASRNNFIDGFTKQAGQPWFKFFMKYDPAQYIPLIKGKVLAVNGDKDVQVVSATNLPRIESLLKKGKSKKYVVKELKGLNHLFQKCNNCTVEEYGQLEETLSPVFLYELLQWLQKNIIKEKE